MNQVVIGICFLLLSGAAFSAEVPALAAQYCPVIVRPYDLNANIMNLIGKGIGFNLKDHILGGESERGGGKTAALLSDKQRAELKLLEWLSLSSETTYGKNLHAIQPDILPREGRRGLSAYKMAEEILASILAPLSGTHPYEVSISVLDRDSRTVFARPGGYLYVDRPLLTDRRLRALATFLIAHETAHLLQRDETRRLQSAIVDSFESKEEAERAVLANKKDPGAVLAKVGSADLSPHVALAEVTADACAVRLLAGSGLARQEVAAAVGAASDDLPVLANVSAVQLPTSSIPSSFAPAQPGARSLKGKAQPTIDLSDRPAPSRATVLRRLHDELLAAPVSDFEQQSLSPRAPTR